MNLWKTAQTLRATCKSAVLGFVILGLGGFSCLIGFSSLSGAASFAEPTLHAPPKLSVPVGFLDLPPDATGADYLLATTPRILNSGVNGQVNGIWNSSVPVANTDGLNAVIAIGVKNLEWLKAINSQRPSNDQLSFTNKNNTTGSPMDKPSTYNVEIILKKYDTVKASLPTFMKSVLVDGGSVTTETPADLKTYLLQGWIVDRVYQSATRWTMMEPYLGYLSQRRCNDIRGYYFLNEMADRPSRLSNFKNLSASEQAKIKEYFIEMGLNNSLDESDSEPMIEAASKSVTDTSGLEALFQKWSSNSKTIYANFFEIEASSVRSDVTVTDLEFHVPFRDPGVAELYHFLADNIQDEWRSSGNSAPWKLIMDFDQAALAHLEFKAGAVAHVNGLGGDIITMDKNSPISEFGVQWTIRHEFGHVIGFPDCYLEFYDTKKAFITSYQLDVTNLMCSRQGHLQQRHIDELKRAYGNGHGHGPGNGNRLH